MIYRKLGKYPQVTIDLGKGKMASSLNMLVKLRNNSKRSSIVRAALRYGLTQMSAEFDNNAEGIKK